MINSGYSSAWTERRLWEAKAAGSNPATLTFNDKSIKYIEAALVSEIQSKKSSKNIFYSPSVNKIQKISKIGTQNKGRSVDYYG